MSALIGMGVTTALCLVLFLALGWGVDAIADTFPVCTLAGIVLGLATATAYVVVKFKQYLR